MNHDRLFHKGTGTVQSKKLYFVLSIVIVLGVTICFFWRVWHTSDRLVTIHGEIITSQAVDMYSQIDTIGRTDLKVIGFLDNNIISCYWIQNARTLSNAAQEEEFEELLVTADYKSGDTRLIRRTNTSPISSVDPFLFDYQTLYSFPFRNGTVSIIMTDLVTGTTETLLRDAAAATSLVGFAKVDQDTAAFLVTADSQLQMVLLWNRSTERLLEIFKHRQSIVRKASTNYRHCLRWNLFILFNERNGRKQLVAVQFNKRVGFVEEESSIAGI